jgi:hypothetical protein
MGDPAEGCRNMTETNPNPPPPNGAGHEILTTILKWIYGDANRPTQEKTRRGVRSFFIFFLLAR